MPAGVGSVKNASCNVTDRTGLHGDGCSTIARQCRDRSQKKDRRHADRSKREHESLHDMHLDRNRVGSIKEKKKSHHRNVESD